jgi:hypothetical protein
MAHCYEQSRTDDWVVVERSFHKGIEDCLSEWSAWVLEIIVFTTDLLFDDKNPVDCYQIVRRNEVKTVVDDCNFIWSAAWPQTSNKAFWTRSLGTKVRSKLFPII